MGFVADFIAGGGSDDAAGTYREAAKKWDELETPSALDTAREAYRLFESGYITPEEYSAVLQNPSSLESYSSDPRLKEAQMRSLDYLQNVGNQGGMTAMDRSQLNAIQNQNAIQARGAREATAQRMAQRGMGGSGMQAVQDMIADQGAATANYLGGTDVAANAQRRALEAMSQAGTLGGQIRSQDFGEAEKKAAAADAINRFNVQNRNVANAANVQSRNQAKQDAINMQNDEWEKKRQKTEGWTNAYTGQAPYQSQAGQRYGEGVKGVFDTAGHVASFFMSDERIKENIDPAEEDIEVFLSKLKPYKWDYKDPGKYGEGKRYGVMAQDMEKSPIGKSFISEDEEGVKRIDYGSAQSTMMAILKDLHDRVQTLEKS